jgi:Protein of unknown function (DUF3054)
MPAGVAMAVDAVVILVFAAVGWASHHGEGLPPGGGSNPVVGAFITGWPFLVGAGVGWVVVRLLSHRWAVQLGPGVTVVVCSVLVGMLLRAVTGQGTAPSFVLVATLVLAVLLLGWRLVAARVG